MDFEKNFIILCLLISPYVILFLLARILIKRRELRSRLPFTKHMLRSPGESLRIRLENDAQNFLFLVLAAGALPAVIYTLTLSTFRTSSQGLLWIIIFVTELTLLVIIARSLPKIWNRRLGYYGELAVGQELDQLGIINSMPRLIWARCGRRST